MKNKILLIVFFSAAFLESRTTNAQILTNTGFENWATGPSTFQDPVGWITNNIMQPTAQVVQAAGRTGNYSVNLRTVNASSVFGGQIDFIYNGNLKPTTLSGYWKGNFLPPGDYLYITVMVFDAGFNQVGGAYIYCPTGVNITNWTLFSDSIDYFSASPPAQTRVSLTILTTSLNTEGFVDDLVMTYTTPTGVTETMQMLNSSFVNNSLILNFNSPKSFSLQIFSADGKKVSEKNYSLGAGQHQLELPTENLPQGIYFCRVAGNNNFQTRSFKFIK
jgi:hypothetical protein